MWQQHSRRKPAQQRQRIFLHASLLKKNMRRKMWPIVVAKEQVCFEFDDVCWSANIISKVNMWYFQTLGSQANDFLWDLELKLNNTFSTQHQFVSDRSNHNVYVSPIAWRWLTIGSNLIKIRMQITNTTVITILKE